MKLILESWRQYLKEEVLTEFNREDRRSVMDGGDNFTVSYEIELESKDPIGDEDNLPAGSFVEKAKELLRTALPNFMEKYEDILKFEKDTSLTKNRGVEFSINKESLYMKGLDNAIEFLTIFFDDYEAQDDFKFTTQTGLHVNIGLISEEEEPVKNYNLIKSLLFLNADFAVRGFEGRKGSEWAKDLKSLFKDAIENQLKVSPKSQFSFDQWKEQIFSLYKDNKFDEIEKILSPMILEFAPPAKQLGMNIKYIGNQGYVEFRYPGGPDLTLDKMVDSTLYYAYLIKLATDPSYKRNEYLAKLVKMIQELDVIKSKALKTNRELFKGLKKEEIYSIPVVGPETSTIDLLKYVAGKDMEGYFSANPKEAMMFFSRSSAPAKFKGIHRQGKLFFFIFERLQIEGEKVVKKERVFSEEEFSYYRFKQKLISGPVSGIVRELFEVFDERQQLEENQ